MICIPDKAYLHSRWGRAFPVSNIPIPGEDVHCRWGTSPLLMRHIPIPGEDVHCRWGTSPLLTRNIPIPGEDVHFWFILTGNAHPHIVFVSFSYRFQPPLSTQKPLKRLKRLKTVKTSGNLLLACWDNLSNLWLLLHRFQKFAFSVKTIRLHGNDITAFSYLSSLGTVFKSNRFRFWSISCRCKLKTQRKVCGFDENVFVWTGPQTSDVWKGQCGKVWRFFGDKLFSGVLWPI